MGEILRNWIQERLGIMIDLMPDVFGHYTRDGTLLAQILHSYDIINRSQLEMIGETQDPALCRVNLKHLRVWLRFIGVRCDDESVEEISRGKGTASLRLFYELYLCLETKDRLHFITLQKEREKYAAPASTRFAVTRVNEQPLPYEPPDHPLSKKLAEGRDRIQWDVAKIPGTIRRLRQERRDLESSIAEQVADHAEKICPAEAEASAAASTLRDELDRFARRVRRTPTAGGEDVDSAGIDPRDPRMTRRYLDRVKSRGKRQRARNALETRMQKALLSRLWERIAAKQERTFDEAVARGSLSQSRYEKRMVTKMCEVREQQSIMAGNQCIIGDVTQQTQQVEHHGSYDLEKDLASRKRKDAEIECLRICELRRRLLAAKVDRIREKHWLACQALVKDLVTIAVNVGDYRRVNAGRVPASLLAEWKSLFLRARPIFAEEIPYGAERGDPLDDKVLLGLTPDDKVRDRGELLRDTLLEDYLEGKPPWNVSTGEEDEEATRLGRSVLGHVVHRLLVGLYPQPPNQAQDLLPVFGNVAIVLGLRDAGACEAIRAALADSGVRVFRAEDAVNFCLARYKEEMSDVEYIDLNVVKATADTVRDLQCGSKRTSKVESVKPLGKRAKLLEEVAASVDSERRKRGRRRSSDARTVEEPATRDRQTQTPRTIPYDDLDPVLTDAACIGRKTYEFLTLGEPLSNELATKILVEYLKSLTNASGWVLLDYPDTYEQMCLLEEAFTGTSPPPDTKTPELDDVTVEDIQDSVSRIVFQDTSDPLAANRRSRLVPDPVAKRSHDSAGRTFATLFVRVAREPKYFLRDTRTSEPLPEDAPSIDRFYASRGIAYVFYYVSLDKPSLKSLVSLVTMGAPLASVSSGESISEAPKDPDARRRAVGTTSVRRLLVDARFPEEPDSFLEPEEEEAQPDLASDDFPLDAAAVPSRPGDRNWKWVDAPLSSALAECLANLWEGAENAHLHELRELLFLKSVHASSVGPYADFLTRSAREAFERPHAKQRLLTEFQAAFNAVDEDARSDADVKCVLHRRVADFQAELWRICDERRRAAEEERRQRIADRWTVREAVLLFNVYVGLVQAEVDRHADTVHLLQDYYLGMLRKPLAPVVVPKPALSKIPGEAEDAESSGRSNAERGDRGRDPAPVVDVALLREEIDAALIRGDHALGDVDGTCLFKGILENVLRARKLVDATSSAAEDLLKRERLSLEHRDSSDRNPFPRAQDLLLEWQYAIDYECRRIRRKLDAVVAVARLDVAFLLETMQATFRGIHDFVLDRYWREMKGTNDLANLFCLAIEEGVALERQMLLDGDRLVILASESPGPDREPVASRDTSSAFRFQMERLAKLTETFRRVAPRGTLSERAFAYILQDLVSHGREEGETMALPCAWYHLRPRDIDRLVGKLFPDAGLVDWREFLVAAMELPVPSCEDLLVARDRLRPADPDGEELVTRAQFHRTPLWFLEDACPGALQLLQPEFQSHRDELFEEELFRSSDDRLASRTASKSSAIDADCDEETVRRTMAKEILCRMYMVDRHSVNYTALLLAFCKDEDPRRGFGKALALALGSRVCVDADEGERYAEELIQRRDVSPEEQPSGEAVRRVALKTVHGVLEHLLHRVTLRIAEKRARTWKTPDSSGPFGDPGGTIAEMRTISDDEIEEEILWEFPRQQDAVVYWISLDLCLTVLAAAVPWDALQPQLVGTCGCLRDRMTEVFLELRDPRLGGPKHRVLAHRLVNHDFVKRLLVGVNRFTARSVAGIVGEILRERGNDSGSPFGKG